MTQECQPFSTAEELFVKQLNFMRWKQLILGGIQTHNLLVTWANFNKILCKIEMFYICISRKCFWKCLENDRLFVQVLMCQHFIAIFQANAVIDKIGFPPYILNKTELDDKYKEVSWTLIVLKFFENGETYTHVGTVETLYNTINFCWSTHKRHSIARPKGRGVGCLLWVQKATYCVDLSILSSIKYLL